MRPDLSTALVALTMVLSAPRASAQATALVGSWRGTSVCVDKVHFPACSDEQVIYDAQIKPATPDTVTLRADKVVNGVREFMAAFDFARATDGSWVAEFQTSRVHLRIVLRIVGGHMSGTLTDVPSGHLVRHMELERLPRHQTTGPPNPAFAAGGRGTT